MRRKRGCGCSWVATVGNSMSWDEYHLGNAVAIARKSKDSTKVGCIAVGPAGEIRSTGFNGPPKGVRDLPERFERPTKYLYAVHAEMSCIAFAARTGASLNGCTMYVTHHPCSACARLIIQSGITRVVCGDGKTSMPQEEFDVAMIMFQEAGVKVEIL
jgi:dCMP deaminase